MMRLSEVFKKQGHLGKKMEYSIDHPSNTVVDVLNMLSFMEHYQPNQTRCDAAKAFFYLTSQRDKKFFSDILPALINYNPTCDFLSPIMNGLKDQNLEFVKECCSLLANLTSHNNGIITFTILNHPEFSTLQKLAENPSTLGIAEDITWTIANICGEDDMDFELVAKTWIPSYVIQNIHRWTPDQHVVAENHIRALSNIYRNCTKRKTLPFNVPFDDLHNLLSHPVNSTTLIDTIWILEYLAEINDDVIDQIVSSGLLNKCFIIHHDQEVEIGFERPFLKLCSNIATGSGYACDVLLQLGYLDYLKKLMCEKNLECSKVREIFYGLENLSLGTDKQFKRVVNYDDYFFIRNAAHYYFHFAKYFGQFEAVHNDITLFLSACIQKSSKHHAQKIVETTCCGIFEIFANALRNIKSRSLSSIVKNLTYLLECSPDDGVINQEQKSKSLYLDLFSHANGYEACLNAVVIVQKEISDNETVLQQLNTIICKLNGTYQKCIKHAQ